MIFDGCVVVAAVVVDVVVAVVVVQAYIAGHPCTDHSTIGTGHGTHGWTNLMFMVWIALRRLLRAPGIIAECVLGFPVWIYEKFLGDLYIIYSFVVSSTDFLGLKVLRTRRITFMLLKVDYVLERPFSSMLILFRRMEHRDPSSKDFLLASESDLIQEVTWAASRTGSGTFGIFVSSLKSGISNNRTKFEII